MKLDELPKKVIYEVPADYFEKLPGVMMHRVNDRKQDSWNIFAIYQQLPWLKHSLAGLALLISFIFIFLTNNPVLQNQADSTVLLASVSKNEAVEYLLTSDQLENADLIILPQADTDFTHEFILAPEEAIRREVELADLNDIAYN